MSMRPCPWIALAASLPLGLCAAIAAPATVIVHNPGGLPRPAATIEIDYRTLQQRLPTLRYDQLIVRDAEGTVLPSQVTSFVDVQRGPPQYEQLLFQHDFVRGETEARFSIEASPRPQPPFPNRVQARHVPERFDDFAWENDRSAHRAYGPGLETEAAGPDRMVGSGLDLWTKRVPYLVMDRWYRKGHDGLHQDTGEGHDFYSVGTRRGVGGTGVWDGESLWVSGNWRRWRIFANGPIRAIFELEYAPFDAGGVSVRETKRFFVDAGHHLDTVQSRFDFDPPPDGGHITVAIGLTAHPGAAAIERLAPPEHRWLALWERYAARGLGELGTAVLLSPPARPAGFARAGDPAKGSPYDELLLVELRAGDSVQYHIGGAWSAEGSIRSAPQWREHLNTVAQGLARPLRLEWID